MHTKLKFKKSNPLNFRRNTQKTTQIKFLIAYRSSPGTYKTSSLEFVSPVAVVGTHYTAPAAKKFSLPIAYNPDDVKINVDVIYTTQANGKCMCV